MQIELFFNEVAEKKLQFFQHERFYLRNLAYAREHGNSRIILMLLPFIFKHNSIRFSFCGSVNEYWKVSVVSLISSSSTGNAQKKTAFSVEQDKEFSVKKQATTANGITRTTLPQKTWLMWFCRTRFCDQISRHGLGKQCCSPFDRPGDFLKSANLVSGLLFLGKERPVVGDTRGSLLLKNQWMNAVQILWHIHCFKGYIKDKRLFNLSLVQFQGQPHTTTGMWPAAQKDIAPSR